MYQHACCKIFILSVCIVQNNVLLKKLIRFLECSLSHEYFESVAKLVKHFLGLPVNFARDPMYWNHRYFGSLAKEMALH